MHGSQRVASEFRFLFHSLMPPCSSVLVAFDVAKKLNAPLDIFVVRKLGVLGHRELALGAIATGGVRVLNEEIMEGIGISHLTLNAPRRRRTEGTGASRTGFPWPQQFTQATG
jgi:predicted phosphoribosyltransferase